MTRTRTRTAAALALALVALTGCSSSSDKTTTQATTTVPSSTTASPSSTPSVLLPTEGATPMPAEAVAKFPIQTMTIAPVAGDKSSNPGEVLAVLGDGAAKPALEMQARVPLSGKPAALPGSRCVTTPATGSVCLVSAQAITPAHGTTAIHVVVSGPSGQCELVGSLDRGVPVTRTCVQVAQ